MQPEDYMTDKDLIKYHVKEIMIGNDMRYHAQELERFLPEELVKKIKDSKLDEIVRFG